MPDRQRAALLVRVKVRGGARPIGAIFGHAGIIAGPAIRIGAGIEAGKLEDYFRARGRCNPEVKPLKELGLVVAANREAGGRAVDREHLDIAAVEGRIDSKNHQFS
jgi:hypothetical protein